MRSILKGFQNPQTEPYVLPTADLAANGEFDLLDPALAAELKALESVVDVPSSAAASDFMQEDDFFSDDQNTQDSLDNQESSQSEGPNPLEFAQVQAEQIIAEARAVADDILAGVEAQAMDELELLRSGARDEGYRDGYARGMMDAVEQSREEREMFGNQVSQELKEFLESATQTRERMIEDTIEELRDLSIAVAEKVVRVSLKASSEVIVRMIQSATDKLKRREWVHIYISGCDSKVLAEVSTGLSLSMTALSDHIRIIPMQDDEIGTCIIETPEEIIDASLSTQVSNIKNLVLDQSASRDVSAFAP